MKYVCSLCIVFGFGLVRANFIQSLQDNFKPLGDSYSDERDNEATMKYKGNIPHDCRASI